MPPIPPRPPHQATIAQPKRALPSVTTRAGRPPHPATVVQRAANPAAKASLALSGTPTSAFLVEDTETTGNGQVRKRQFLAALRSRVIQIAAQILAPTGQTVQDCPYIPYWFSYYEEKDAQHIEQALNRYAPEAGTAKTWQEYVEKVAQRVRLGFEANVKNGSLAGVPSGIPRDLDTSTTATVQGKAVRGTIQMCGGESEEAKISRKIDEEQRQKKKRIDKWRKVVPMTQKREIVFRKLSKISKFDVAGDERVRPIEGLDFEQNEAHEGISLSRNPLFVADTIRSGLGKVIYACALPAGGAYDLEAAYLNYTYVQTGKQPDEYTKGIACKLSQEVTAESVSSTCIIGWVMRDKEGVVYHHNKDLDKSFDYKELDTYDRFLEWVEIIRKAGGDLTKLPL